MVKEQIGELLNLLGFKLEGNKYINMILLCIPYRLMWREDVFIMRIVVLL